MFNGIEADILSLGDADCIIVTQWVNSSAYRVLIDGGSGANAEFILDFLRTRGYTELWAALCTHPHNDHARGLAKVVQNRAITIHNGWMHDIRNHVSAEVLRRAVAADDGVKEVVETTRELSSAFISRRLVPREPFGQLGGASVIAGYPFITVLGPSVAYYKSVVRDFINVETPAPARSCSPPLWSLAALALGADAPRTPLQFALGQPPRHPNLASLLPLAGALSNSSVKTNPTTQPFNNTSVILGVTFAEGRLLFTGDAGSEALAQVTADWNHLLYMGVPHHGSDGNLSQKDIERFCPRFATISAKGDSSHPSRAIVSGLVKVGAKVASTHKSGNLWFWSGNVPARTDYGPVELLKGTGEPEPVIDWTTLLSRQSG